ncbi:MAG TPA: hypothetical protein VLM79_40905 [Kofleriaceae bacterium]|nr:hypothetical protein [Kofleriaceae bacterium]
MWGLLVGGTGSALHADPAGGPSGPGGSNPSSASNSSAPIDPSAPHLEPPQSAAALQPRALLLHEQMRGDARHVMYLQQIAKKEKDVIKLNCVNDKLVQIKPQMNMADAAESEMTSPADATRMTAFDNIVEVAASVRRLREEADQCIGEAVTAGDAQSSNSFTGPHAPDDPTKGGIHGTGGGNDVEAPGYASPFN